MSDHDASEAWLVRPLGWSRGLRIGVFADELERTRYVESLELEPQ